MAKTVQLKPRVAPRYKYNINQQIGLLPNSVPVLTLIGFLSKNGISKNVFYRDRQILYGSAKSISADRLQIYAQVFDCTIEALQNQPIKAKSIREAIDEPVHKKAVGKSKLK